MRAILAVAAVWAILFAVPFVIYGAASGMLDLKPPPGPAWRFLLSVAVTKAGTAIAFVALFALSRANWRERWVQYGGLWFVMFAVSEIGDLVKPDANLAYAALGILSEAIYAPASALTVRRVLR